MRTLIIGANGQLGTELRYLLDARETDYRTTDNHGLNSTDKAVVDAYFKDFLLQVVYHCAVYTAASKVGAIVVYISTDYVFHGDQAVQRLADKYYIIRTSWVYGEYGKNFVYTMLKLAQTHDQLTVVNDQFGRPSWTRTLAEFMTYALDHQLDYGIYHLSNDNSCNWYEFAQAILKDKNVTVSPVTSAEYPQKAWRPRHSILDLSKTKATGFKLPTWQEALAAFMQEIEK